MTDSGPRGETVETAFNDLIAWVAAHQKQSADTATTYKTKAPTDGARGAAHNEDVKTLLPTYNVEAVSAANSDIKTHPGQLDMHTADDPVDAMTVLRYGKVTGSIETPTGKESSLDEKADLLARKAAGLQKLLTKLSAEAPVTADTAPVAGSAPTPAADPVDAPFGSKEAADKVAVEVVTRWRKQASSLARQLGYYQLGFTQMTEVLTKAANAPGGLAALLAGGAPGEDMPPPDAAMAGGLPPGPPAAPPGPDAGGAVMPPGGGGAPSPEEVVDQTLAGLMEATGMSPQQLCALVESKLQTMGGGDGYPAPAEGGSDDAAPPDAPPDDGGDDEKKEASRKQYVKLANDLRVLQMLTGRAAATSGPPTTPKTKAARELREKAREYFADLRRSVA